MIDIAALAAGVGGSKILDLAVDAVRERASKLIVGQDNASSRIVLEHNKDMGRTADRLDRLEQTVIRLCDRVEEQDKALGQAILLIEALQDPLTAAQAIVRRQGSSIKWTQQGPDQFTKLENGGTTRHSLAEIKDWIANNGRFSGEA